SRETVGGFREGPSDTGITAFEKIASLRCQLRHCEIQRSAADERSSIGLATGAVFKEHTVSATDRHLSISARIPREPNTRRRIKPVRFLACIRNAVYAALH